MAGVDDDELEQWNEWMLEQEELLGYKFFDYQQYVLAAEAGTDAEKLRVCLYYRTGAGKTATSLLLAKQAGHDDVLVVCPPSTYDTWIDQARTLGLEIRCVSHAKFRMADYKVSRTQAVIVDEFHMLGGNTGKGFLKLDKMAQHLKAPLILNSATPNYNDAERVYCIQHVLDPLSCRGGFLAFLYKHCDTEANRFSMTPKVLGFLHYADAAEYLAALPGVYYVEPNVAYTIKDAEVPLRVNPEFLTHGYDRRRHRMIASTMERMHQKILHTWINEDGHINDTVLKPVLKWIEDSATPVLIYCTHSTIAEQLVSCLTEHIEFGKVGLVTGDTPKKKRDERIDAFRDGVLDVLVGTATLGTGTDGLDKVCDTLIIVDDTTDPASRTQLVGRIMPRGASVDASNKHVYRLVLQE